MIHKFASNKSAKKIVQIKTPNPAFAKIGDHEMTRIQEKYVIDTPPRLFWQCRTRVRRLVRDASKGCFGRGVPGYADWHVTPSRVVLAWVYQGMTIGT